MTVDDDDDDDDDVVGADADADADADAGGGGGGDGDGDVTVTVTVVNGDGESWSLVDSHSCVSLIASFPARMATPAETLLSAIGFTALVSMTKSLAVLELKSMIT